MTDLEAAVSAFLEAISFDMCCELCEPGGLGEHREDCAALVLWEAAGCPPTAHEVRD